ncbi:hypothetical protein [Tomitella gaofuii]|uniref:hypothetical protein n=1 Tax=Tomitella gaofuii TaxID=2760083 RepID=UPI0015F7E02A|nr:hypothetical protein [Tomitella gaofuii]
MPQAYLHEQSRAVVDHLGGEEDPDSVLPGHDPVGERGLALGAAHRPQADRGRPAQIPGHRLLGELPMFAGVRQLVVDLEEHVRVSSTGGTKQDNAQDTAGA